MISASQETSTTLVQRVDATLDAQQISPERACEFHAYRLLLRGCVALFAGDLPTTAAALEEAARIEHHYSDPLLGLLYFLRVHLLRYEGRLAEMQVCAERALTAFARAGYDSGVVALQRELEHAQRPQKASLQFAEIFSTPSSHYDWTLLPYLRAYIARGANLAAIVPVLNGALAYRAGIGDLFNQLQLLALETWLQLQLQGKRAALRKMRKVMELAQETGYVRVPLEIPALVELIPAVTDASGQATRRRRTVPASHTAPELTDQERVVLNLLAADYSYQQIAAELIVSVNTVRTHVRHLNGKLAVHRREQAIEQARRRGLVAAMPERLRG